MVFYLKGKNELCGGVGVWGWGAESAVTLSSINKHVRAHTHTRRIAHFGGVDIFTAGGNDCVAACS